MLKDVALIFSDVRDEFTDFSRAQAQLQRWKDEYPQVCTCCRSSGSSRYLSRGYCITPCVMAVSWLCHGCMMSCGFCPHNDCLGFLPSPCAHDVQMYHEAFISMSVPSLVAPYVRVELLGWVPRAMQVSLSLLHKPSTARDLADPYCAANTFRRVAVVSTTAGIWSER